MVYCTGCPPPPHHNTNTGYGELIKNNLVTPHFKGHKI